MPTRRHYKDIVSSFIFLDETGLIHNDNDKFFAIGIIKCIEPKKIYSKIRKIRQQFRYNEEIKWAKIDRDIRFKIAMEFFQVFLEEDISFNCIILDKSELDFDKYFSNNLYKAYQNFTIALLKLTLGKKPKELLTIIADDYFTPDGVEIEDNIKKYINNHYNNFVITGVCQIDSKASDLLQLVDLILGAIVYDLKKQKHLINSKGGIYKRRFLNYLYQKMNVKRSFFINKFNWPTRNYVQFGDKLRATIFDCHRSTTRRFLDNTKKQAMTHDG